MVEEGIVVEWEKAIVDWEEEITLQLGQEEAMIEDKETDTEVVQQKEVAQGLQRRLQ
jgi:hypothetical protein